MSDHSGVASDGDPNSEFKKRNIAWSFATDATGTDAGVDGGLLAPLGEPLTYEAARSRLCFKDITEGVTLTLSSENIFSGLAAIPAIEDDAVSLYKLDFGWSSLPAAVAFTVVDDGCYRVHTELNFGNSNMAARLTQESGEPITSIIGGTWHGGLLPITNSHFESEENLTDGWLLQEEEEANVSVVPAESALEGTQSIRLVGKTTLRYNLEAPVAGPWLIRYLSQTSTAEPTTSCWVEIRQAYTAVSNPALTYSTKPKCFPQNGGVSRGECRFDPVKTHPVTGDALELVSLAVRLGSTFADGDGNYCIFDELRVLKALAAY